MRTSLEQEIRFCTAPDGVRLAYATAGHGPPLVKAAHWLSHLDHDWSSPVWRPWFDEFTRNHTLVRYDERGCGLSDWNVDDFSLEAWVRDLETVVDALGLDRFPLLGLSQGGPVAVLYAVRHPEKVSHLILLGSYARGWLKYSTRPEHREQAEALLSLTRAGWGRDNPAFRQFFTAMLMPEATAEQTRWLSDIQRISTSPENAVRFLSAFYEIDVADAAAQVAVPTLVFHAREDAAIPFNAGRELAALIPGARFVTLEDKNHFLLAHRPTWPRFLGEVRSFLGVDAANPGATPPTRKEHASKPPTAEAGDRDRLSALFEHAVGLSPSQRRAFLDEACADDPGLRRELESLLRADDEAEAEAFLDDPVARIPRTTPPPLPEPAAGGAITNRSVDAYRLLHLVGRGGMGLVYKAFDERLERPVALKFLSPHWGAHDEAKARFIQEARAASALDHANICTIYDIGETSDGRLFIAMAFCEGQTLKDRIARGPLPVEESLDVALQVADGLACAHKAGVVHRDLKPANLVLTPRGTVKILDFGIAKLEGTTELTKPGTRIGTAAYMSPEQARGEKVDHRTDLWSLGVVLYEMLTGNRPFRGEYEQAILYAVLHEEPPPVRELRPEVPEEAARIVERLLGKTPDERYRTMQEVCHHLYEAATPRRSGPPTRPTASPPPEAERSRDPSSPPADDKPGTFALSQPIHFVGRADEYAYLQQRLDDAVGGVRQVVFVTGEAGAGKTTLVDAFVRSAREQTVFRFGLGQCLEHRGAGEAYMPVLEALGRMCRQPNGRALIALLAEQAPTWLAQMPGLIPSTEYEALQHRVLGTTRERMLREMVETLELLTTRRPVVLVLEDLHWSDHATIDLLDRLARRQEPARLLLIGTYRPADVKRRGHPVHAVAQTLTTRGYARELALPFLTEAAIRDYLAGRFPETTFPTGLARLVHHRTDGNALFMGSLVDAWIAQGKLTHTNGGWSLQAGLDDLAVGVPESLRKLIEQQIEQLGPEDRALLETASVAGMDFSAAAVAVGVNRADEDVEARCETLARQSLFLRPRGTAEWADGTVAARYGFIHALYQDIFYDRVPAGRRVRLHRQIGDRLEAGYGTRTREHAAELAMHFVRGRDTRRAVQYLRHAARQAMGRSAHQEAIEHLNQGLHLLKNRPDLPQRARLELSLQAALAPALILTKGWASPEAERTYARARELCREPGNARQIVPVLQGMATLYEVRGDFEVAESLIKDHLRDQHEGDLLESCELLACSTFHQGNFTNSLEHADNGLLVFDPEQHNAFNALMGDNPGASCHTWAALALWFLGYPDQALERLQDALRLVEDPDHAYGLSHAQEQAAIFHQCRREVSLAREWAEATITVASRQGIAYRILTGTVLKGWAMAFQGQGEDGIEQIRQGLLGCDRIGAKMDRPYYLGLLAEAYGATDRVDDGLSALDEALSMVRASRSFFYEAELHRLKGALYFQAGAPDDTVEACLRQALEVARRQQAKSLELRIAMNLGRLWAHRGKRDQAHQCLATSYQGFTEGFDTPDLQKARALLDAWA